jgi:FtsH-binding integral membrane protein
MSLFLAILITAIIYLAVPLFIRFILKKNYDSKKAFTIAAINYFVVKVIEAAITSTELDVTRGWLYLLIGHLILCYNFKKNNEENNEISGDK